MSARALFRWCAANARDLLNVAPLMSVSFCCRWCSFHFACFLVFLTPFLSVRMCN